MYRTRAQKEELVKKIFTHKSVFEEHVLDVFSDDDRLDIMQILSKKLIREDLKEELNFLYMKDLADFKFSLIVNLLFKAMANEWVSFAKEHLLYTRGEALDEIQDKERVNYLFLIVKSYFGVYKRVYVQEIAETFIELVDIDPNPTLNNQIIKDVLGSSLVKRNSINVVHNYHQLWSRVKDAHNLKNIQISKIQIKISEVALKLEDNKLSEVNIEKLTLRLKKLDDDVEDIKNRSLSYFDEAVKRVKETITDSMLKVDSLESLL